MGKTTYDKDKSGPPPLTLETQVQFLKGVGPHYGQLLGARGIRTVRDLLEWYPRAYEDRRVARSIQSLRPGETVSLAASVVRVASQTLGKSTRRIYDVVVKDDSGFISCKYFRVPYKGYFERFQTGTRVRVVGKVTLYRGKIEFHHPDLRDDDPTEEMADRLMPLYTETEGLSILKIRNLMKFVLDALGKSIPDPLPLELRQKYKLLDRATAIQQIHIPPKDSGPAFTQMKSEAHRRLIFEEFFWMELLLANRKSEFQSFKAPSLKIDAQILEKAIGNLPFPLTGAQNRVLKEIIDDIEKKRPMHRLVQGDVGSGKTIVSLLTSLVAIRSGYQVALMAPTEILAEQHLKNTRKMFPNLRVELLTGRQTSAEHKSVLDKMKSGEVELIIGTHALIQEDVEFKKLGLVIVDEQHRFGVEQRKALVAKGESPHFLIMTATPIPRTLAMTVYGDLDVSIVDELPPGRTPIVTRVVYSSKERVVYQFIKDQLAAGRQAYIIYPLVEESEKIDLQDAVSAFEKLKLEFANFQVGLLHGKMKGDEKDAVMEKFRSGQIQVLIATTVVEVGVDVPNANLILIEHTERFGLSQLHQLRGRVGRGSYKSYCILKFGFAVSEEARARAEIMAKTNNGFEIAEADLEMRGPGEFMGTRQSGLPGFKLANLVRDVELLIQAREAAFDLISKDPSLKGAQNKSVLTHLSRPDSGVQLGSIG